MSANAETNVRIAPCTLDALRRLMARRETSRDETIRQLLAEHVRAQEQKHPEARLTHISTVLRYPPPPRWRGAVKAVPLRVRAPHGLLERARAASLRLPGQHPRAHRDYQGRMLTDAVTTAIAAAEPFTDDFLTGLLPLLRHSAALGLWRLTVATTSTGPEKAWLVEAEAVRADQYLSNAPLALEHKYALRVAEILENDEAWHAADRFRQAIGLARNFLTGPQARHWEQVLYDQDKAFDDVYQDHLQRDGRRWRRRHGITSYDFTGRGGTAVWRAQRRADREYFEEWLVERTKRDPAATVMKEPASPGWLLRTPSTWLAHAPSRTPGQPPEPFSSWAADGRLLTFPYLGRQAFWPLLPRTGSRWQPVPGFEPVAAAAATLRPDQVLGFIEALLIDWNHTFAEEPSLRIALDLPADKARRFNFITAEEQHRIMAEARATTLKSMDRFIARVADAGASEIYLQKLTKARGNAREFHRLTLHYSELKRPTFGVARATWRWPGRTVAAELATGASPELLQWLATAAHRQSTLLLEQAMHAAWQRAFDQYGFRM